MNTVEYHKTLSGSAPLPTGTFYASGVAVFRGTALLFYLEG
jgi:hypothetical protein